MRVLSGQPSLSWREEVGESERAVRAVRAGDRGARRRHTGLRSRRPVCVGKPSAAMFEVAASVLGVPPADTLVIGDNLVSDIAGGAAVGARTSGQVVKRSALRAAL